MSEGLDQFKNKYAAWFASLDDTARGAFDSLFRQHPEDTYWALTGEALPERSLERAGMSLTEVLNPEGKGSHNLVPAFTTYEVLVDPKAPDVDQNFVIRWTEMNVGVDSPGHADKVQMTSIETGEVVWTSDRIELAAIPANGELATKVDVPGLPAGSYQIEVTLNVDGAYNPADAARNVGMIGGAGALFGVGGVDPYSPRTPDQANFQAIGNASFYLSSIGNSGGEAQAQENLALALDSYVGVLPMGTTKGDDVMPRMLRAAAQVRSLVVSDPVSFQQAISADAKAAAAAD